RVVRGPVAARDDRSDDAADHRTDTVPAGGCAGCGSLFAISGGRRPVPGARWRLARRNTARRPRDAGRRRQQARQLGRLRKARIGRSANIHYRCDAKRAMNRFRRLLSFFVVVLVVAGVGWALFGRSSPAPQGGGGRGSDPDAPVPVLVAPVTA